VAGRNLSLVIAFTQGSATASAGSTDGQSATFTLTNNSSHNLCIVSAITIRGQKLTSWNAQEVSDTDAASIAAYGRFVERIDARLLEDTIFAGAIIQAELLRHKDPHGLARSLRLMNRDAATLAHMLALTMGDRITVVETQTAMNADYIVRRRAARMA